MSIVVGAVLVAASFTALTTGANASSAPTAPINVDATGDSSNSSVWVTWSPPTSDGGSAITSYTINPSVGAPVTVAATEVDHEFTGLSADADYVFTVHANNTIGASPGVTTAPRSPILLSTAPRNVIATAANGSVKVTWERPAHAGSWFHYKARVYAGATQISNVGTGLTSEDTTLTWTKTGLTNGTAYTVKIYTANYNSTVSSDLSAASNAATPGTTAGPVAVVDMGGSSTYASFALVWNPPVSDGGSTVTSYTVTPSTGSPVLVPASETFYEFTGLSLNTNYTFTIQANNAYGAGTPVTSGPWAPMSGTTAPNGVSATPGNGQATITWSPPTYAGNWYHYKINTYNSGGALISTTTTGIVVGDTPLTYTRTGLTNGQSYTFKVFTSNYANTVSSPLSAASNSVTPNP